MRGSFTLSEGGRWEGRVRCANAVISGEVQGTLAVAEKLEIRATARLRGALSARSIAVARGAVIEGDMAVTSGAPVVHYEEKRKGLAAVPQHPVRPLIHCVSSATPAVST